jgi:hypothetical protein
MSQAQQTVARRTVTPAVRNAMISYAEEEELQRYFRQRDLTDGLPIIIPAHERVARFLREAGFDPSVVVGAMDPARGVATVHNVAVNALMAGCEPSHLSVVLAAIEAMVEDRFRLRSVQCTTNPAAPLAIVNGPVRDRIGVASGRNALSPGQHANGVIGRAIRLAMRNIGGAVGDIDRSTLGWPAKYTFCLGEAEEQSPWEPLHVSLGYAAEESVVTMVAVESFIDAIPVFKQADEVIDHLARAMRAGGTNVYWSRGTLLLVLNPGHAEIIARGGYDRPKLQERLFEDGAIPLDDLRTGNIPMGDWVVKDGRVQITESPADILVMVAGGPEPLHSVYMTGFGVSNATSARVWQTART